MMQVALLGGIDKVAKRKINTANTVRLPKDFRENYDQIEWRKIIAFRPILAHDYYKINPEIVWNAIENKLMDLKVQIEMIQ